MANAFDPSRVVDAPPEEILRHRLRRDSESGVHVEGLEDLLVRLASCCTPVPGDPIIGFVTRGRGISVHRTDCANALGLSEEQSARLIDVDWDVDGSQSVVNAGVEVVALDRTNLLRDVANALGDHHVNIVSCETLTGDDRVAKMRFEFELKNATQLHTVLHRIKAINSVYDAYRIIPGGSTDNNSE
jgi:GTP pyrophosphokinase